MILVTKTRPRDCGVCCIASIFEISWESAALIIFGELWGWKKRFGTKTRLLIAAARRLGAEVVCTRDGKLIKWPRQGGQGWRGVAVPKSSVAVVKTLLGRRQGSWHWILWDGRNVYDPQAGETWMPEKYPYEPTSYILIRRA